MHPSIRDRDQARQAVEALKQAHTSSDIKLMDFVSKADRKKTCEAAELSDTSPDGSLAILRVPLRITPSLREELQSELAVERNQMRALTTSGKLRLVRSRLGLPQPKRNRS